MKVALDTTCFIDAVNCGALDHDHVQSIFAAVTSGKIVAVISRHTLAELTTSAARGFADRLEILPHWPIGTIAQQVAQIRQLSGTWEDSRRNEEIQQELARLAKSGSSIRDRGAYLDALFAKVDFFVTSDRDMAGSGPAARIRERFGLCVLTPSQAVSELRLRAFPPQNAITLPQAGEEP